MNPDFWYLKLVAYASLIWQVLRGIRRLIRYWRRLKKEAPIIAESTRDPVRFFPAFIVFLAICFAVLLLLIVSSIQPSSSRPLIISAAGVAALILIGTLLQVVAMPAHGFLVRLKKAHVRLKREHVTLKKEYATLKKGHETFREEHATLKEEHHCFEKRVKLLEAQNLHFKETIEGFEAQLKTVTLELQFPIQRKFARRSQPPKERTVGTDHDADLIKQTKVDVKD